MPHWRAETRGETSRQLNVDHTKPYLEAPADQSRASATATGAMQARRNPSRAVTNSG